MAEDERRTDSGIPVEPLYTAADLDGWDAATQLGEPGRPPVDLVVLGEPPDVDHGA